MAKAEFSHSDRCVLLKLTLEEASFVRDVHNCIHGAFNTPDQFISDDVFKALASVREIKSKRRSIDAKNFGEFGCGSMTPGEENV
jgi:hypothetical protein